MLIRMKRVVILGSTGSIGKSSLEVARNLHSVIRITGLAAYGNIDLLEKQAREFSPEIVAVFDAAKAKELQTRLPHITVLAGMEGMKAVASYDNSDLVISAISGTSGLEPTAAALEAGKNVGLANKETLVSGGEWIVRLAKEKGSVILPIDSEHSAILQCLQGEEKSSVSRLIVTASGGPFHQFSNEQLQSITVEQALKHPTWLMGPKITIDSSTLMNKGLEVIEAHWLFDIPIEKIDVVIHPQSILHSMVEFKDGSMKAQMSVPSMTIPIQYAITYPHRMAGLIPPFDFAKHSNLQFFAPDTQKFRCLALAYHAVKQGGSLPCYMNAANEVLGKRFLEKEISWRQIGEKLENLMESHPVFPISTLQDILEIDAIARQEAAEY
jgi:1-deoxy-D-xylulose-5-phosphate reductoisomerase